MAAVARGRGAGTPGGRDAPRPAAGRHALTRDGGGAPGQSPNPSAPPGRRARGRGRPTASGRRGPDPRPGHARARAGTAAGGDGGRRETKAAPRHHTTPPPGGGGGKRRTRAGRPQRAREAPAPRGARHRVGKTGDGRGRGRGRTGKAADGRRPGGQGAKAPENGKRERWRRGPRATARGLREASEDAWEPKVGRPGAHAGSHRPRPPAQGRSRGTRGRRPGPHGGPQATSRGSGAPTATVHATGSPENALPHTHAQRRPAPTPPRASFLPFLGGPRALRPGTPPQPWRVGGSKTPNSGEAGFGPQRAELGAAHAARPRPCGRGTRAGGGRGGGRVGGDGEEAHSVPGPGARGEGPVPERARQRRREPGHRVNAHGIPPPPARGRSRDARDAGRPQHPWQTSPQTGPHTAGAQGTRDPRRGGPVRTSVRPSAGPSVRSSVRSNPESRPGEAPPGGSWPDPCAPAAPPPAVVNPASVATLHAQRRGSGWGLRYPKAPSRIAREGFLTEGASPPPFVPPNGPHQTALRGRQGSRGGRRSPARDRHRATPSARGRCPLEDTTLHLARARRGHVTAQRGELPASREAGETEERRRGHDPCRERGAAPRAGQAPGALARPAAGAHASPPSPPSHTAPTPPPPARRGGGEGEGR
ncbi:collagen alpha-1(I) chain-like [Vulpes lagopus]|uniref:collagen alpha-1(I) chain-like n=1 Tax=Vulpes lagopus TaxID=494514 RepID=UPI001BC97D32|nr:collagen alpha-1(I) chain-like [Vulpes lagopus]